MTGTDSSPTNVDVVVIGGGIAGASIASFLAADASVVVLEREPEPDRHSTGRSAAVYYASYGSSQVRTLTAASRAFLDDPPAGFADHPLVRRRGLMMIADDDELELLRAHRRSVTEVEPAARWLEPHEAGELVPIVRHDRLAAALFEPDVFDMDVHALHQGFLRSVRRRGGRVVCGAGVTAIDRERGEWRVVAGDRSWRCQLVVDAAGAWADVVASMAGVPPIGLVPKRRSAFVFAPPADCDVRDWPLLMGVGEDWYLKPEAGTLLGSPANADPVEPHDVRPEELDIALAIDRIEAATTLEIRRPLRTWAGLRSFVTDGGLVGGPDPEVPSFIWVAAQGGYGIQTAPAMGEACAALALGRPVPAHLAAHGVTADALSASRLPR